MPLLSVFMSSLGIVSADLKRVQGLCGTTRIALRDRLTIEQVTAAPAAAETEDVIAQRADAARRPRASAKLSRLVPLRQTDAGRLSAPDAC